MHLSGSRNEIFFRRSSFVFNLLPILVLLIFSREVQSETWENAYLRGTPNNWSTTPMFVNPQSGLWETVQTFDSANPRFKVSRFENWNDTYPAQDFLIAEGAGDYTITFDDITKNITANKVPVVLPAISSTSICFDNPTSFANPTIYFWQPVPAGNLVLPDWPGNSMTAIGNYVCFDMGQTLTSLNVIFNDSGNNKTLDLTYTGDGCYQSGAWISLQSCGFAVGNEDVAPTAYAGDDLTVDVGTVVNFNGSGSSDSDGTISSYSWSNGLSGASPSLVYDTPGTFTIVLTVTDNSGLSANSSMTLTVQELASDTIIYFNNTLNYVNPSMHYFDVVPQQPDSEWPGVTLESLGDNWYRYNFGSVVTTNGIVFSDSGANKTADLVFENQLNCYNGGTWFKVSDCNIPSTFKARAGDDRSANANTTIVLSSVESEGEFVTASWTSSAWTGALDGKSVITPQLNQLGDFTVTLTLTDANNDISTDELILSVLTPVNGLAERPKLAEPLGFPLTGSVSKGNYQFVKAFPNLDGKFLASVMVIADGINDLIYVVDKPGVIYVFPNDEAVTQAEVITLLDIEDIVRDYHEQGLLSMAFDPDYINNGHFYVYYINGSNDDENNGDTESDAVLDRWTVDSPINPTSVARNTQAEVLRIPQPGPDHKGGMMQFHPEEGYLYISVGDGAYGHSAITPFPEDPRTNNSAQDTSNLRGSMLRINVLAEPENGSYYAIPSDNPFVGNSEVRDEIWSYGHRNPWRWAFDQQAPHTLWQTEVGQQGYEEVNLILKGQNYGWPICEGLVNRGALGGSPDKNCSTDFEPPVNGFDHTGASSIIGGFVYRGNTLPALTGKFLFGDYNSKKIWSAIQDEDKALLSDAFPENIASFGTDSSGNELYVSTYGIEFGDGTSSIYKAVDTDVAVAKIPDTLSTSGIFADLSSLRPVNGVIEYDINSDGWFDGANARHFMSIPNETAIDFAEIDQWDLPVGSVLVKHLDLIRDGQGNTLPFTTSVLFRQDSGWQAANYRWNTAGTDADLVTDVSVATVQQFEGGELIDKQRTVLTAGECSSCHVGIGSKQPLAINTRQLNRDFDYQGVVDNQLDALNFVSLLDQNIAEATTYDHFEDPEDTQANIGLRAQTYLDTNCSHCHSSDFMNLAYDTSLQDKKIINVKTGSNQYRVKPFDVANSLLHIYQTTDSNRMPKGTRYTNPVADSLFTQWINGIDAEQIGIAIQANNASPKVGDNVKLLLNAIFDNGFTASPQGVINWTSSNPAVLSIGSATGELIELIALKSGTTFISASVGSFNADIEIAVEFGVVAPSNLVATALSSSKIELNWQDNSADEIEFSVLRSTNSTGPFVNVASLATNSFSHLDTGLQSDTQYYYQLQAISTAGSSIAVPTSARTKGESSFDSFDVLPGNVSLLAGDTQQLFAVASQFGERSGVTYDVQWQSSDEQIVAVSSTGVLSTGSIAGNVVITATLDQLSLTINVENQGEGKYVYFEKPANWPDAYIWAWTDNNGALTNITGDQWPGLAMEQSSLFGGSWYRYAITENLYDGSDELNLLFNCGSGDCKTEDLNRSKDLPFWFSENNWLFDSPVGQGSSTGTQIQVGNGTITFAGGGENLSGQLFIPGATVVISANDPGPGKQFVGWEGSGTALLLNANSSNTSMLVEDVLSITLFAIFDTISDTDSEGRASYQTQCSGCHGSTGNGSPSLAGVKGKYSLPELSQYISDFMPINNAGSCTGECAENVAQMIYNDTFEPPVGVCNIDSLDDMVPQDRGYRLLSNLEYNNTIRDLINSDVEIDVTTDKVPPTLAVNGFATDANTVFTDDHSKGYILAAEAAADKVTSLFGLVPECGDIDCVINSFGKKAYRRPITTLEFNQLKSLYNAQGERGLLVGIFASPALLYRSEVGEQVSNGLEQGFYKLTDYEIASLLSYTYWATTPDVLLISAADDGELSNASQLQQQISRLLADEKAQIAFERFVEGWLNLDKPIYANIDENLKADMKQETFQFVKSIVFEGGFYEELLNANYSYMTQALAGHYGLNWPGGNGVQQVNYNGDRRGILGHASILAGQSTSESTHPIKRGLFVRRNLLCQDFPPPPVGADLSPVIDPSHTVRERYESHQEESCKSCHQYIDGIGFGLESFDNLGLFRTEETTADGNVRAIDNSGHISSLNSAETFLSEGEPTVAFNQLSELASLISDSRNSRACYARQWYRYIQGQREEVEDSCTLQVMGDTFKNEKNMTLLELMTQISQSKSYTLRK